MLHPRAKRPPGLAWAEADDFAAAVLDGLSRPQKTLPCRFFYDARGSELFEEITRLPEYYPTRTETAILEAHAAEMAEAVPAGGVLVEFGSGSSLKTEILLRQLPQLGGLRVHRRIGERARRRAGAPRSALPRARRAADRRRFLPHRGVPGGPRGAAQDRVLPGLHHRQPHAGRGRAPARAFARRAWRPADA